MKVIYLFLIFVTFTADGMPNPLWSEAAQREAKEKLTIEVLSVEKEPYYNNSVYGSYIKAKAMIKEIQETDTNLNAGDTINLRYSTWRPYEPRGFSGGLSDVAVEQGHTYQTWLEKTVDNNYKLADGVAGWGFRSIGGNAPLSVVSSPEYAQSSPRLSDEKRSGLRGISKKETPREPKERGKTIGVVSVVTLGIAGITMAIYWAIKKKDIIKSFW